MSWRNNPKIRELAPYAKKHGYVMVILTAFREDGESYEITTYGRDLALCKAARIAGDQLDKMVQDCTWPVWTQIEGDE